MANSKRKRWLAINGYGGRGNIKPQKTQNQTQSIVTMMVMEQLAKERRAWMDRCIFAITASYAADLMDKWGWSPSEVDRLTESATKNFSLMLEKFVTLDDFVKWCEEKGINIGDLKS